MTMPFDQARWDRLVPGAISSEDADWLFCMVDLLRTRLGRVAREGCDPMPPGPPSRDKLSRARRLVAFNVPCPGDPKFADLVALGQSLGEALEEIRVGGDPPVPVLGMRYRYEVGAGSGKLWQGIVSCLPVVDPRWSDVGYPPAEVQDEDGRTIWRREALPIVPPAPGETHA